MKNINVKSMILAAMFAALTAVGAFIKIPMWPVPFTLQIMFMAMAGIMLGPELGAVSQLVYLVTGLIGIPVFTNGGGIGYIAQPSFGFLLALVPCAYIIGLIYKKRKSILGAAMATLVGFAVLYMIGLPYMYIIVKYVMGIEATVWKTLFTGMIVFMPGDALKIAATALIAPKVAERVRNASGISARGQETVR